MTLKEIATITAKLGFPFAAVDKFGNLFIFRKKPELHEESGGWMCSVSDRTRLWKTKYQYDGDWKDSVTNG